MGVPSCADPLKHQQTPIPTQGVPSNMIAARRRRIAAGFCVALAIVAGCFVVRMAWPEAWRGGWSGYASQSSYAPNDTAVFHLAARRPWGTNTGLLRLEDAAGRTVRELPGVAVLPAPTVEQPWEDARFPASVRLPLAGLRPGVYRLNGRIPLVVRAAPGASRTLLVVPTHTVAAYSQAGGKSLYVASASWRLQRLLAAPTMAHLRAWVSADDGDRARTVGTHRPSEREHGAFFDAGLAWIARTPSPSPWDSLGYLADDDLDTPGEMDGVRTLVIVGHSEYWTRAARRNVEAFVASGGRLLVLSGNTAWWQMRRARAPSGNVRLTVVRDWEEDAARHPDVPDSLRTVVWTDARLGLPISATFPASFAHGGFGTNDARFRMRQPSHPLLDGVALGADSSLHLVSRELDGVPDTASATDRVLALLPARHFGQPAFGAFVVRSSVGGRGAVVHLGSTDVFGAHGVGGPDSTAWRRIVLNALAWLRTPTETER